MVTNRKVTGKAATMPGGLAIGGLVSGALTIALAGLTGKMVDMGTVPEEGIGYLALAILLLSSGAGAAVAARRIKRQRLAVCLMAGVVYYLFLLGLTALFFGGQYTGMGVTALAVLAGSGAVALTGAGQGRREKRHRRRIHR